MIVAALHRQLHGGCDMERRGLATEGVADGQDAECVAQTRSEPHADSDSQHLLSFEAATREAAAKGPDAQEGHQAVSRGKANMQNVQCGRPVLASGGAEEFEHRGHEPDMPMLAAATSTQKRAGRASKRAQGTGNKGPAQADVAMMDVDALTGQMASLSTSQPGNRFQPNVRGRGRRILL